MNDILLLAVLQSLDAGDVDTARGLADLAGDDAAIETLLADDVTESVQGPKGPPPFEGAVFDTGRHRWVKPGGEVIGKGSTGEVVKHGDEVHKNAKGKEGEVYKAIGGKRGVAAGREEDGEIITPHFANVLSVDAVPQDKRTKFGNIVAKNLPDIVNAVTLLTDAGYDYNDPLQVGFDRSGNNAKVFDFSAAQKTGRENAMRDNMDHLSNYLNQFGAARHAAGVSRARVLLDYMGEDSGRMLEPDIPEAIDGLKVETQLSGAEPKYAYYAFNAREIPSVAQTEHRDGLKVIFSPVPLADDFMKQWEILPAIHRYE